jgi:hypothetical protein
MKISREWAMPSSETFSIKPIEKLIHRYIKKDSVIIDPFARGSKIGTITNDLSPVFQTDFHLDAKEFLQLQKDSSADIVLFDPPYSPRQITEVYQSVGIKTTQQDTQSSFYGNCKTEIARILKINGIAISCYWNSIGIGKKNKFEIIEVLLVCHGGFHNDTIVTVERKFGEEIRF